jgi:F-type H+-transporting ATPase subunit b
MSAFFESFGVNWISLVWYVVLFGLVLFLLRRFAFGPILGAIDNRQRSINEALDDAEKAVASVTESHERAEKILWDASAEAQDIIRNAERVGNDLQEQARQVARAEADSLIAKARTEIERERTAAVQEIRRHTVDLALTAATQIIGENLDDERNRKLAEEAIQKAELSV